MLKILVYTLISAFGWIVILFMDESEMFLYQNVPFLNLILVFYSLRIFIGISIIILPCKLLSYLNFGLLKKWTQRLLIPCLFFIPFIISPPDSWGFKHKKTSKEQKAHLENLLIQNNNIHSENSLICFLSVHCTFCKLAGKKLGVIKNNLAHDDQLQIVIHNDSSEVQKFFKKVGIPEHFNYHYTSIDTLLNICGGTMPTMFLMKNNCIINEYGSRSLNDLEIINQLNKL